MKKRTRLRIALRWLFNGRTYGAMIGPTPERKQAYYAVIDYRQYCILDAFKVTSLQADMDIVAQWLVWDTDLIELHAPIKAVCRWVRTGVAYK